MSTTKDHKIILKCIESGAKKVIKDRRTFGLRSSTELDEVSALSRALASFSEYNRRIMPRSRPVNWFRYIGLTSQGACPILGLNKVCETSRGAGTSPAERATLNRRRPAEPDLDNASGGIDKRI